MMIITVSNTVIDDIQVNHPEIILVTRLNDRYVIQTVANAQNENITRT